MAFRERNSENRNKRHSQCVNTAPPSRPISHSDISVDISCPPKEHIMTMMTNDAIDDPESDGAHVDNSQNKQPTHELLSITHAAMESTSTTQGIKSVLSGRPITRSMSNICVGMSFPPIEQFVTEDAIDDPVTEISILTMSDDAHVDTKILELSDDGANIDSDSDTEDEQVIPTPGAPSDTQGDRIDRITNLLETMMKSLSDYDTS